MPHDRYALEGNASAPLKMSASGSDGAKRLSTYQHLKTIWAASLWRPKSFINKSLLVDLIGIEPMTSSMPWKRAPSCATGPRLLWEQLFYSRCCASFRQTTDVSSNRSPGRVQNAYRTPLGDREHLGHSRCLYMYREASLTRIAVCGALVS
jgi:hypothetical protein